MAAMHPADTYSRESSGGGAKIPGVAAMRRAAADGDASNLQLWNSELGSGLEQVTTEVNF